MVMVLEVVVADAAVAALAGARAIMILNPVAMT